MPSSTRVCQLGLLCPLANVPGGVGREAERGPKCAATVGPEVPSMGRALIAFSGARRILGEWPPGMRQSRVMLSSLTNEPGGVCRASLGVGMSGLCGCFIVYAIVPVGYGCLGVVCLGVDVVVLVVLCLCVGAWVWVWCVHGRFWCVCVCVCVCWCVCVLGVGACVLNAWVWDGSVSLGVGMSGLCWML